MIILHLLVGVAFILLFIQTIRVNKLQEAMKTQSEINKVTKKAFDLLAEDVANDRVLKNKTIAAVKGSITKLQKKVK